MIEFELDLDTALAALGSKESALDRFLLGAAGRAATLLVEPEAATRVFGRRRANVQDSPVVRTLGSPRALRVRVEGRAAYVDALPHITPARTPGMRAVAGRLGITLEREGLWMSPHAQDRGQKAGYPSRAGLKFYPFAGNPHLETWARNTGRGAQLFRQTISMPAELRLELILRPAADRSLPRVAELYVTGIKEALA